MRRLVYTESVNAFTKADFEAMFKKQGLQITEIFGDYHFNSFDEQRSPRLIIVATKL
jgi:predicted xylose isomerase-like sugar epimerase